MNSHSTLTLFLASVVGIGSVARTARLLIHDSFPPIAWARARILGWYADDSEWAMLWQCPFCITPYLAAGMFGWAWLADLNVWWWVINGIWAGSYASAILYSYDQPE